MKTTKKQTTKEMEKLQASFGEIAKAKLELEIEIRKKMIVDLKQICKLQKRVNEYKEMIAKLNS